MSELVCDLCFEPEPTWVHPALSFPVMIEGIAISLSAEDWLACQACHRLIEAGDANALAIRCADSLIMEHPDCVLNYRRILAQVRQVHAQFFAHRYGEAHRIEVQKV